MTILDRFFSSSGFLPHGFCLLWRPDILALHAISDVVIAASYFSIPLAILSFVRRRTDLIAEHKRVAILFCVFILGCGLTHVFGVIVLWRPLYVTDGLVKAFTATASVVTAFVLWPVLPRLLEIPSPGQLARANAALQAEVSAKELAVTQLIAIRSNLEAEVARRTEEVHALARRFEIATAGSLVTVSEQDAALRYTWLHNPRPPLSSDALGRTDDEALDPQSASVLSPLKRQVLRTGELMKAEVALPVDGKDNHFDLKITPARLADGGSGLLVAAIDVTEQKRQQEHLQVIMRELAHRAKNLLSLVEGVAHQTAKAEGLPKAFIARFSARLSALGAAYDLLVGRDWRGVEFGALVAAQLGFILPEARERITLDGPELEVAPEVGQYMALALHELATNATKYGALSQPDGRLAISWRTLERPAGEPAQIEVSWIERGVRVAPPQRSGFGRLLLEKLVPRALNGQAVLEFGEQGLAWRISFAR